MGFLECEQVMVKALKLRDFVQRRERRAIGCVILAVSLSDVPGGVFSDFAGNAGTDGLVKNDFHTVI